MAENKISLFPVFDVPATLAEDMENQERYAPAPRSEEHTSELQSQR